MARKLSENESVSIANDIADEEFIQKANDAQDRLQSIISNTKETGKTFVVEKIVQGVANQDGYSINDRIFFSKSIEDIQFSYDGTLPNYRPLKKLLMVNRMTDSGTKEATDGQSHDRFWRLAYWILQEKGDVFPCSYPKYQRREIQRFIRKKPR
jgi:hypothetical protein